MSQEEMNRKAMLEMKAGIEGKLKPAPKAKAKTNAKTATKKSD